jgi:hypothetical protein
MKLFGLTLVGVVYSQCINMLQFNECYSTSQTKFNACNNELPDINKYNQCMCSSYDSVVACYLYCPDDPNMLITRQQNIHQGNVFCIAASSTSSSTTTTTTSTSSSKTSPSASITNGNSQGSSTPKGNYTYNGSTFIFFDNEKSSATRILFNLFALLVFLTLIL